MTIPDVLGLRSIVHGQNLWVASGFDETNGVILISSNGIAWTAQRNLPPATWVADLAYGQGRFVPIQ